MKLLRRLKAMFNARPKAGDSPQSCATAFLRAAYTKGEGVALAYVPQEGEEQAKEKLRALTAAAEEKAAARGGLKDVEVTECETSTRDPDRAQVQLRVLFADGEEMESVDAIRVDGRWRVRLL